MYIDSNYNVLCTYNVYIIHIMQYVHCICTSLPCTCPHICQVTAILGVGEGMEFKGKLERGWWHRGLSHCLHCLMSLASTSLGASRCTPSGAGHNGSGNCISHSWRETQMEFLNSCLPPGPGPDTEDILRIIQWVEDLPFWLSHSSCP